jgi:hypothetical protein
MRSLIGAVVVAALLLALGGAARAIPPFARKYGMACSTCHVGGPTKLSAFGEAFRDNGYRIPGEDPSYLRDPQMPLGDPSRAALFPRTVWPGEIPGNLPIGIAGVAGVDASIPPASSAQKQSLTFPATAILLAGGSLGRHLGFFAAVEGGTQGFAVAELFGVARSLFERWIGETHLNLKVGRLTFDIFPVQPRLQRSIALPLTLSLAVGRDGFTLAAPDEAIEVYGLLGGRFKWLVGVANGVKPDDDFSTRRDLFARLSVKIGGPRLDYRDVGPKDDDAFTLSAGISGYWGVGVVVPTPPEVRFRNDLARLSGDVRVRVRGLDLLGQLLIGRDSDPDGTNLTVNHLAWIAEADYSIFPWLQPYARYEEARFDSVTHPDRHRLDLGVAGFIRTNVRVRVEGVVGLIAPEPHLILADLFMAM